MTNPRWRLVQDRWPALRSRVALYWPRLRPDAVRQLTGDRASLVRLVKDAYALTFAEAEAQVDTWLFGVEHELGAAASGGSPEATPPKDDQTTPAPDAAGRRPKSEE
jgi:hypothetical protein